jgi:type VI protein secretion system component Hcp
MPIYLVIDGIPLPGGSGFGLPLTTAAESFSAVPGTAAQFAPLSMTFPYNAALPFLMHMGALNIPRGAALTFTDLDATGTEVMYMKFTLTNAMISSLEVIGGAVGMPYIAMSFTWQTTKVQTAGAGGGSETFNF